MLITESSCLFHVQSLIRFRAGEPRAALPRSGIPRKKYNYRLLCSADAGQRTGKEEKKEEYISFVRDALSKLCGAEKLFGFLRVTRKKVHVVRIYTNVTFKRKTGARLESKHQVPLAALNYRGDDVMMCNGPQRAGKRGEQARGQRRVDTLKANERRGDTPVSPFIPPLAIYTLPLNLLPRSATSRTS